MCIALNSTKCRPGYTLRLTKQTVKKHDTVATKVEYSSCDTIVYNGDGCKDLPKNKNAFYRMSGVTYWQHGT